MGYKNNQMGYRNGLLDSRAIIKKGLYAILPHDGLVRNTIPGFENCELTILATPKLGATFVDYHVSVLANGGNEQGFGEEGVEIFFYVIKGKLTVGACGEQHELTDGGYVYLPPGERLTFKNHSGERVEAFLYKKTYEAVEGIDLPEKIVGNTNHLQPIEYEGMKDVLLWDLLPTTDLRYDMNFHILSFAPGASHGYVETHFQEHGAYILSGQGMYNLDNDWFPVEKDDYIFMGAYVQQAAYAVGRGDPLVYLYSKDCNRDPKL